MRFKDSTLYLRTINFYVSKNRVVCIFVINPLTTVEFSGKRWQSIGVDTVFIMRPVLSTSFYKTEKIYDRNNNCVIIKKGVIVSFF